MYRNTIHESSLLRRKFRVELLESSITLYLIQCCDLEKSISELLVFTTNTNMTFNGICGNKLYAVECLVFKHLVKRS